MENFIAERFSERIGNKKNGETTFLHLFVFKGKEKLLLKNDSIYAHFLEKSNLRFEKGESNILERTTAETQRGTISIQLKQLQQDLELVQLQFDLLLNATRVFIPKEPELKIGSSGNIDSSLVSQHPFLKIIEQQKKISRMNQRLERSRLLPDLNIGYYSMTMRGTGADNKFYTTSSRFQAVQVGIGIPLFSGFQRAKINASKINQSIAENEYLQESNLLQNQYKSILGQYQTNLITVNYFETSGLKNATLFLKRLIDNLKAARSTIWNG